MKFLAELLRGTSFGKFRSQTSTPKTVDYWIFQSIRNYAKTIGSITAKII